MGLETSWLLGIQNNAPAEPALYCNKLLWLAACRPRSSPLSCTLWPRHSLDCLQQQLNLELSTCMSTALTVNRTNCTQIMREMLEHYTSIALWRDWPEIACLSWLWKATPAYEWHQCVKSLCLKTHRYSLHGTQAKNSYVSDPVNSRFKTRFFHCPCSVYKLRYLLPQAVVELKIRKWNFPWSWWLGPLCCWGNVCKRQLLAAEDSALLIARGWEGRPGVVAYACAAIHCQSLCCCTSALSPGHCHYTRTLQQQPLGTLFHTAFHS